MKQFRISALLIGVFSIISASVGFIFGNVYSWIVYFLLFNVWYYFASVNAARYFNKPKNITIELGPDTLDALEAALTTHAQVPTSQSFSLTSPKLPALKLDSKVINNTPDVTTNDLILVDDDDWDESSPADEVVYIPLPVAQWTNDYRLAMDRICHREIGDNVQHYLEYFRRGLSPTQAAEEEKKRLKLK